MINWAIATKKSLIKKYLTDGGNLITVVYGYDASYYITDGHHHAYAIWLLYKNAGLADAEEPLIPVYVHTEHNYNNNDFESVTFWAKLLDENYFWPYGLQEYNTNYNSVNPNDLPDDISQMGDDPFRSIFGLARRDSFDKPKDDEIGFYQFKWAACAITLTPAYKMTTHFGGEIDY